MSDQGFSITHHKRAGLLHAGPACGAVLKRGFTLLEMMLAVALIAITATFIGINISQSDARLGEYEARRFVALLNMALDESIVTGRPMLLNVNDELGQYQFAPMDVPAVFIEQSDQPEASPIEDLSTTPQGDPFFKPRLLPQPVKMVFTRLPDLPDPEEDFSMVPEAVHELLNKSLFEQEDEDEGHEQNGVLIEPNGLISPFELVLSVDDRVTRVGLDAFGRAIIFDAQ